MLYKKAIFITNISEWKCKSYLQKRPSYQSGVPQVTCSSITWKSVESKNSLAALESIQNYEWKAHNLYHYAIIA